MTRLKLEQYFDYTRDNLRIFNEFSGEKSSKILSEISCVINREIKFQSEENIFKKKVRVTTI